MNLKATVLALSLLVPSIAVAQAWNGPVEISATATVPAFNANTTSLEGHTAYGTGPFSWTFPVTLGPGQYLAVYSIHFSDKYLLPGAGVNFPSYPACAMVADPNICPSAGQPWRGRSNAVILFGLDTVHSHDANRVYGVPRIVGPGFTLTGVFGNATPETQNMIVIVTGILFDGDFRKLPGMGALDNWAH